jgi:SprT protein
MNDQEIKDLIINKSLECYKLGKEITGRNNLPESLEIVFNVKGGIGGYAFGCTKIDYNFKMVKENLDDYIKIVIPHEVAHILNFYPNQKRKPHGKEWKSLCIKLGGTGERCHHFKVEKLKEFKRDFIYKCINCGKEYIVTENIHNKILKGQKRICGKCRNNIVFCGKDSERKLEDLLTDF